MSNHLKKSLLAGTTLFALSVFAAGHAHAVDDFDESALVTGNNIVQDTSDDGPDEVWDIDNNQGGTGVNLVFDDDNGRNELTIFSSADTVVVRGG